ncbi:MAG: hypothetical protein ACR2O1_12055 [Boseongicola sp.]
MKPRSDKIGKVEIFSEKMDAARELSSCCIGVEAHLEADANHAPNHPESSLNSTKRRLEKAFERLIKAG